MSGCVARRWAGTGTCQEKPQNAELAKEVNDKFSLLKSAREQQDQFFGAGPLQTTPESKNAIVVKNVITEQTVAVPVWDPKKTRGF